VGYGEGALDHRRSWLVLAVEGMAAALALATLVFVVHAFVKSPQNPVAAEIGYEALRVARGLPLYVDPWRGAWEDGAPPARYYVLYTPIFPWLVGKLSPPTLDGVRVVGRLLAAFGWLVVHIAPVAYAPRDRRRVTAVAAMLAASIYFISRHAVSMSPDTFATAFVILGVARAVKNDRIDPLAAVLTLAGPFIKPSCLGAISGAAVVHLALRRPGWVKSTASAVGAALLLAMGCHLASDGAWLSNIKNSTGQPLTLTRWFYELGSRILLLGLPHAIVAFVAFRRKVSWFAVGPLVGSTLWASVMMAKHGSGAHYWLEPTGLALIAVSQLRAAARPIELWGALVFGVLVAITGWPQYLSEPAQYREYFELARRIDAHCVRKPGEFVMAGDLRLELTLNGRISVPAWQSAFLARTGRFPLDAWRGDMVRPEVRWLALSMDPHDPPGKTNDEIVELSPYYDILKDVVLENYELDAVISSPSRTYLFRRK
jgi:hypothetical protein